MLNEVNEKIFHSAKAAFNSGNYNHAQILLEQVLTTQEDYLPAMEYLIKSLYFSQKYEQAAIIANKMLRLNPTADNHHNLAIILQKNNSFFAAENHLLKAIEINPDFIKAYVTLLSNYQSQNKPLSIYACLVRLLTIEPENIKFLEQIIQLSFFLRLNFLAADYIKMLSSVDPNNKLIKKIDQQKEIPSNRSHHVDNSSISSLMATGDYLAAFSKIAELSLKQLPSHLSQHINCLWSGDFFSARRLLIYANCKLDEIIIYSRYIKLVKDRGGIVVFALPPQLKDVISAIPGADYIVPCTEHELLATTFDYFVNIHSLPFIFGTSVNTIPAHCFFEYNLKTKLSLPNGKSAAKIMVGCYLKDFDFLYFNSICFYNFNVSSNKNEDHVVQLNNLINNNLKNLLSSLSQLDIFITDNIFLAITAASLQKQVFFVSSTQPSFPWFQSKISLWLPNLSWCNKEELYKILAQLSTGGNIL